MDYINYFRTIFLNDYKGYSNERISKYAYNDPADSPGWYLGLYAELLDRLKRISKMDLEPDNIIDLVEAVIEVKDQQQDFLGEIDEDCPVEIDGDCYESYILEVGGQLGKLKSAGERLGLKKRELRYIAEKISEFQVEPTPRRESPPRQKPFWERPPPRREAPPRPESPPPRQKPFWERPPPRREAPRPRAVDEITKREVLDRFKLNFKEYGINCPLKQCDRFIAVVDDYKSDLLPFRSIEALTEGFRAFGGAGTGIGNPDLQKRCMRCLYKAYREIALQKGLNIPDISTDWEPSKEPASPRKEPSPPSRKEPAPSPRKEPVPIDKCLNPPPVAVGSIIFIASKERNRYWCFTVNEIMKTYKHQSKTFFNQHTNEETSVPEKYRSHLDNIYTKRDEYIQTVLNQPSIEEAALNYLNNFLFVPILFRFAVHEPHSLPEIVNQPNFKEKILIPFLELIQTFIPLQIPTPEHYNIIFRYVFDNYNNVVALATILRYIESYINLGLNKTFHQKQDLLIEYVKLLVTVHDKVILEPKKYCRNVLRLWRPLLKDKSPDTVYGIIINEPSNLFLPLEYYKHHKNKSIEENVKAWLKQVDPAKAKKLELYCSRV